ncbi:MAG: hypothetical protein HEP71_24835 [Roseivirga sp.]|nr:hypothetical protein [Roseivirga sp.]
MIATLFGVLLAVTLSNAENLKKEKSDTIKLLKSARNIVSGTYAYTDVLGNYATELKNDSTKSQSALKSFETNNPLPYPEFIEPIISSEIISKNITENSHAKIYTSLINLKKISLYQSIDLYKNKLNYLFDLVTLEIEYQKGNISLTELNNEDGSNIDMPPVSALDKEYRIDSH